MERQGGERNRRGNVALLHALAMVDAASSDHSYEAALPYHKRMGSTRGAKDGLARTASKIAARDTWS